MIHPITHTVHAIADVAQLNAINGRMKSLTAFDVCG